MPAGAPKKRGRKPKAALAAAPTEAAPAPKKRGRKPKAALAAAPTEAAPVPKKRGRKPKAALAAAPSVAVSTGFSGSVNLTNLDLELINRVLNMSIDDKLALIKRLS